MLEKFLLLKHVYKSLRRNKNLVIITDDAIKTQGDHLKNINNIRGTLNLLKAIEEDTAHGKD